jgi:hypothetical protein
MTPRWLSALLPDSLTANHGEGFFQLLEDVRQEAAVDPTLQADIRKLVNHPKLKALLRH